MATSPFRINPGAGGLIGRARQFAQISRPDPAAQLAGGGATDLSPIPTAGLVLWLAADSGLVTVSSTVIGWTDQSPEGNDANTDGRDPSVLLNEQNDLPMVNFSGAQTLSLGQSESLEFNVNNADEFETFSVIKDIVSDSFPNDTGVVLSRSLGNDAEWQFGYLTNVIGTFAFTNYGGGSASILPGQLTQTGVHMLGSRYTASQELIVRANGNDGSIGMPGSEPPPTGIDLLIGSSRLTNNTDIATNLTMNGKIGEIIVYNRELQQSEREEVETYLIEKWALPFRLTPLVPPAPGMPPRVDSTMFTVDQTDITVDQTEV